MTHVRTSENVYENTLKMLTRLKLICLEKHLRVSSSEKREENALGVDFQSASVISEEALDMSIAGVYHIVFQP